MRPKGGSRPGERRGGRKKGAANRRTCEIANKAATEGITPLEVLLEEMQLMHTTVAESRVNGIDPQTLVMQVSELRELARAAAPFIHPRLQSSQVKVADPVDIRIIERVIVRA